MLKPLIAPLDTHNQTLLANVHPQPYENPTPSGRYNLVVIGAGTAGLITAAAAAGLGAKVALVEKHLMGGDCLNVGCVPSKALIRASRAVHEARRAGEFGVRLGDGVTVDFGVTMERMRRLRASMSRIDSVQRFRSLGVDVYIGEGRFAGGNVVDVEGKRLEFSRAVIASGARAASLPIPGLDQIDYLTNENVFWLTELPRRLVVLGAGPIGCELGQAFRRFGADVTIVSLDFLPKEDADTAEIIKESFRRDGIKLELQATIESIGQSNDEFTISYQVGGERRTAVADQVLLGAGRAANVEGLGLESVGVQHTKSGVVVDDHLQTTNPLIYAAGDVCSRYQFTHVADATARIVIQNTLFFGRKKVSALHIPWCTYTDPEVAHVGLHAKEAEKSGIEATTMTVELKDVDRAILDGATEGFAHAVLRKGSDKLLGMTIVAEHAGEMIGEAVLAMNHNIGLGSFANTIHPYPTQAEVLRKLGDAYNRTRLTPTVKRIFEKLLAWRR
ncbi:MAG: mercuric reductase [Deltaproteobacteria bacterium]|nr:mercuric reductase [Deltaproteobacteria bacterium]